LPPKRSLRAAAIGSIVRFLIRKRTLGMAPVNDRFWPKAAVALKPSRMSELGQQRTLQTALPYVRLSPRSRRQRRESGHAGCNVCC
jgi:hypothetical protein